MGKRLFDRHILINFENHNFVYFLVDLKIQLTKLIQLLIKQIQKLISEVIQ